MQYDHRYDHDTTAASSVREALEPYLSGAQAGPHSKLSISLPADLLASVRDVAVSTGTPLSGVIAAALRRLVDEAEQLRMDRALQLDAEENVAWAEAGARVHGALIAELEW
jgi:hypothetical protein